jgi:hypothetical protein
VARIIHQIGISVSSDTADILAAFSRSSTDPGLSVVSDAFTDYTSGSISLPADGTIVKLSLGNLADARGYYLELFGLGSAKLWINQGSQVTQATGGALTLRPSAGSSSGTLIPIHSYQDATITSLALSSLDAVTLSGAYVMWGYSTVQP